MARNMNRETLEQKIAKTEEAISRNCEQYDSLTAELEVHCIVLPDDYYDL